MEAYLKGKEQYHYKNQGLSDWANRARHDFIKITRTSSDIDHIRMESAMRNAIVDANPKVKVGKLINADIDRRIVSAGDYSVERKLVADSKTKVNVTVPGIGLILS